MRTGEVSRVDINTGERDIVAEGVPGLDNLAFDSRDRLFVSNAYDGSVAEVLPSGRMRTFRRGGMIAPGGVAVLARPGGRESVFVGDAWTLREFDGRTGRQQSADMHDLAVPGPMTNPFTVAPDGDNLVLSSWMYGAVQVWSPDKDEVIEHNQDFGAPVNAIRFRSDLVVADLASGSVVQRDSDTGEHILLAEGLAVPAGLAATDDELWVSEFATGVVWQIVNDGIRVDPMILVAEGLLGPEGLAVDLDGSLLVVETGAARLSRISLDTGEATTVADGLALGSQGSPATPPAWFFNGVAVGPSGAIYVTGDVQNVLYRLRPTH
jgi:hypothetical protein